MANPHPITHTAAAIATQLAETAPGPRSQIWRTVRTIGPERAQAFVKEALEVEANGGMLIPDGSRTLGGIFFYLVRTQVSDAAALRSTRGHDRGDEPCAAAERRASRAWSTRWHAL